MMTIGILTLFVVGTLVHVGVESTTARPKAKCTYSKDTKGLMAADCTYNNLLAMPDNIQPDVESLDLRNNYIGKLANDSFELYPYVKKLFMSFNKVHTVEPHSLESLSELDTLDLMQNALHEVPAGLPKSLRRLYLTGNPVTDMHHLANAVGLQMLSLKGCDLPEYPSLGLLPNLVELDVAENSRITELEPVQLAGTCRLAKLNVTDTALFEPGRPGSRCQCRRVEEWVRANKIRVFGMPPCPEPAQADGGGVTEENCTLVSDEARAVFKACMAEWEHRNTPYWAIGSGLVVAVAVVFFVLCYCVRRRRRKTRSRRTDKVQSVPPTDIKENNSNNDTAAAGNKTEPAALLS